MADTILTRKPRHRVAEETLASSSRSTSEQPRACSAPGSVWSSLFSRIKRLDPPLQGQQQRSPKRDKAFFAYTKGVWLLLALLLVPHVQALPASSRVPAIRRSAALERGPATQLLESKQVSRQQQGQAQGAFDAVDARARHLDRGRPNSAAKGKQRDLGSFGERRSEIFPPVVAINSTNGTDSDGEARTLTIVLEQSGTDDADVAIETPGRRWGQTATYLASHNIVLAVGGQTGLNGDITNDVYALDLSHLAKLTSNSTSQNWQRLSSDGLPAHAYSAASSVIDRISGEEKLWIVGGITEDCATDAPAYVWSAPVGNITAGKWTAVYPENGIAPTRRRGAKAVTLGSSNSSSIMVVGGTYDSTTCSSTDGTYAGIDMWSSTSSFSSSLPSFSSASSGAAHVGLDLSGAIYSHVQSLALDPRMTDLSLTDYTAITLAANGTSGGEKIVFLGGKDSSNTLVPLSSLWALDVSTGDWERLNTTGLIPSPRMGHTAVVTRDDNILIHGGYLQDPSVHTIDNAPISETFLLDTRQNPPRWDAVSWTSQSIEPPALAFHSAVMGASDLMVVGFGKVADGPANVAAQSFVAPKANADASSVMHYLDASTVGSAGGMTWSSSIEAAAHARQALAATASWAPVEAGAPMTPAVSPAALPTATASSDAKPAPPAPSAEKAPTTIAQDKPSAPTANKPTSSAPSSSHTGAIAGSLLGAAALAATIGAIYAYRKRREAAAYNLGRASQRWNEHDNQDKRRGPPVSALHLGSGEAGGAGWGARVKRAAANTLPLTKSHSTTTTAQVWEGTKDRNDGNGVQSCDAVEANVEEQQEKGLPDEFITCLLVAEDETIALGRGELLNPNADGQDALAQHHSNHSRRSVASADASHFSYPYLATVHRSTSPTSMRSTMMEPGDTVSPYQLPHNPFASPDSIFWNNQHNRNDDDEQQDSDTAIAMDGRSAWHSPIIPPPPRAKMVANAEATRLRVTNAL